MALFYRHWGSDDSSSGTIVAIHGLFGSLENLGMVTRQLKDDYSVYALDLPNHGRSSELQRASLSDMAAEIIAWMDSKNLHQAYFLGHSLGGKVSMELALKYPDRVKALIIADIAPVAYPPRHDDVFNAFSAVDLSQITTRKDADDVMKQFVPELSTRSFLLKNLKSEKGVWSWRINLDALSKNYSQFIKANSEQLNPFLKPVLFLKGELSDYILPKYAEATLKLFPKAEVKIINGTNHWLHAEKPDSFVRLVKRFLSKI